MVVYPSLSKISRLPFFLTQTTPRSCCPACSVLSDHALPEQERRPQEMQNRFVTRKSANSRQWWPSFYRAIFRPLPSVLTNDIYTEIGIKEKGRKKQIREGQRADVVARRVNVRMINEERWIARRRTNTYQSRLLIIRFAWSDKNKASIDCKRRREKKS